jgi:hypothetical protein
MTFYAEIMSMTEPIISCEASDLSEGIDMIRRLHLDEQGKKAHKENGIGRQAVVILSPEP